MASSDEELLQTIFGGVELSAWNDVDVTWVNARFVSVPEWQRDDGPMPIALSVDMTNEDGDTREDQRFTLGSGFVIEDGGARVSHANPKHNNNSGFGNGSKLQVLLNSAIAVDQEAIMGRYEATELVPRTAEFWEGFTFHIVEEEKTYKQKGKEQTFRQQTVTKVIGWDGLTDEAEVEVEKPAAKPKPKPKPKAPAKPKVEEPAPDEGDVELSGAAFGLTDDQFVILRDLALGAADYDAFMTAAYEVDEIVEEAFQAAVDVEDGGLFSQVTA